MPDFTNIIDGLIAPFTAGFVTLARLENPGISDTDLVPKVEGELKHFLRGRIGWAVDFLWGMSAVKSELDREIAAQVAANRPFVLDAASEAPPVVLPVVPPANA